MELYDQHVHSNFSFDSQTEMESQFEQALKLGLKGVTITEHFSVDPLDVSYGVLRYAEYRERVTACQKKYAGRLSIGCGLEIGEPHLTKCRQVLDETLKQMELDFIIGSVHNIGSVKLSLYKRDKTKNEFYTNYFQEILQMVKTADFDIVGHMDLSKRYGFESFGNYDFEQYKEVITEILKTVIERNKGIEINTSGFRNKVGICYPSPQIVQLYHDLGGKHITLGSDAHTPDVLAYDFDRAVKILKDAGFTHYDHYLQHQPIPVAL